MKTEGESDRTGIIPDIYKQGDLLNQDLSDKNQVTILHLSDLHFNEKNAIEIDMILESLLDDLQKLNSEYGLVPDLIIISGDIANIGSQSDYNVALDKLGRIRQELNILPENVFIVPGNHDINRNKLREFSTLRFDNEEDVSKFLSEKGNERNSVFKKLGNFTKFAKNFYGTENPYEDKFYMNVTMQVGNRRIGIVGLNSSWFSGENRYENGTVVIDKKELVVGEYQARSAYDSVKNSDICITIMHHPFSWLNDFDEGIIRRIVMKNSHIVFQGHIHSSLATEIVEPDSRCLILSAGASYMKNRIKRYNLCKINLLDFSYTVYLRVYSDESKFWARDTLTYQTGEGIIEGKLFNDKNEPARESSRTYPFDKPDRDIERFAKENWKKLVLTKEYRKSEILEMRRVFFHQCSSNPPLGDIALQIVQYLLGRKIIRTREELENAIFGSPFIAETLEDFKKKAILDYFTEDYFEKLSKGIFLTRREEIQKFKEREFLIKKEQEMSKKIQESLNKEYERKVQELEKKRREMEEEYKNFKSTIDDFQDLEEKGLPKVEEPKPTLSDMQWFEELGLKENPFPSHIGLEGFDEEMYDDVVVKTGIFHKFDREIIVSLKSMQRRSYLVYGSMGSGKTTLFKYLQKTVSILKPNVFAVFIPLEALHDFENIRYDFYQKLFENLEKKYFSENRSPTGIERGTINDVAIFHLFKQIVDCTDINHFILFIDDLHKHPKYVQEVFEFISGLQIFRSHMYEYGINLTIFIAGDVAWISHADGIKAIGGSIDVREQVPEISVQDAAEMINKRLKIFARSPDDPPTIKTEYVEIVFKILRSRIPIEVTFRDVMEEVEKHWKSHEFESLKLSIILDFSTLSSMLLDIEADHPGIKAKIDGIWEYAEKDRRIFNHFVEIMESLYSKGGISENSFEFQEDKEYYGILYWEHLIIKQRKKYSFVWILTKEVREMFLKFEKKYGFKPSEYLSNLYLTEGVGKRYVSEESSRMSMILKTGGAYGESFLSHIKDALEKYRMIFGHTTSIQELYSSQELVDLCKRSITGLMKATLIVCENNDMTQESFYDVHDEFIDNWFENPDLTEFVDTIQKKEIKETEISTNDLKEICRSYFRAVKTTLSNLRRFMKYNSVYTLESRLIYTNDKKMLNEVRKNFYNANYALALDKINSLMKNKLRDIIYTTNCLIYGANKWKRGLPSETNKKLIDIAEQYSSEKIILNSLKLTDLVRICVQLDGMLERVFCALFSDESWQFMKGTLFSEEELQEAKSESLVDRRKEEILDYVLQARILVEKIDSFYYLLFSDRIPFLMNYSKFGIFPKKKDKLLCKYQIEMCIVDRILKKIEKEGNIELDFSRYTPHAFFQHLSFVDWIMYIYHMTFELEAISIDIMPNGKVIIH